MEASRQEFWSGLPFPTPGDLPNSGILDPAQKEHSGRYECQGLDLETTTSLQSDQQELVVNCEGLGAQDRGARLGQEGIQSALPCLTPLLHPQMCLMSG